MWLLVPGKQNYLDLLAPRSKINHWEMSIALMKTACIGRTNKKTFEKLKSNLDLERDTCKHLVALSQCP